MSITHNTYENGKVMSLRFKTSTGRDATVGVIEPGVYDFGVIDRQETIVVIDGELVINGEKVVAGSSCPHIIVEAGKEVNIAAVKTAAYICYYG